MEAEDFDNLPLKSTHTIDIVRFVDIATIDPVHYEKSYYIEPESVGAKPFALLRKALEATDRVAIAKVALRQKEHLCLIRPYVDGLIMETMYYPDEIRGTAELDLPGDVELSEAEMQMAVMLIDQLTGEFQPAEYQDEYRGALQQVIEAKLGSGAPISAAPRGPAGQGARPHGSPARIHRSSPRPRSRSRIRGTRRRRPQGEEGVLTPMTTTPQTGPERAALALGLVEPMIPTPSPEPSDAPDRLYEIKWEGIRAVSVVNGDEVQMHTRGGTDITGAFPGGRRRPAKRRRRRQRRGSTASSSRSATTVSPSATPSSSAGSPERERRAARRSTTRCSTSSTWTANRSSTVRLYERKARLHDALHPNATVHVCHFEEGEGVAMYAAARQLGLHGIVAKDKHSLYEPGKRSRHWLSTKHARTMNLVVGGYTFGGSKEPFDSLLLGVFEDGLLRFTGAAGAGTARGDQRFLHQMLSQRHTTQCPFTREPRVSLFSHWCEPSLAVEVEFGERSPDGTLRFLVFNSLRPDIKPRDCDVLSLAS